MSLFGGGGKPTAYSWERQDLPDLEPLDEVDVLALDEEATPANPRRRKRKPVQVDETDQVQDGETADVDKRLRSIARRVRSAHKRSVACILEIGGYLAEAQDLLASSGTGSFTAWLKANCNTTRQTAYRYIGAWRWVGSCQTELQSRFEITALTRLAAESTPEEARAEALQLAESGETVTNKTARSIISKHHPPKPATPKTTSLVVGGGAVVVRTKPGVDPVAVLESALAELRSNRSAA